LKAYEAFAFGFIERISPPKLRLSVTAAAEHFTAMFAGRALTENVLDGAHPVLRDLLRWHAAEELEHRSVAFDVLQRVDPSYALRIAGMMVATPLLVGFWIAATTMLLAQDRAAWPQLLADLRRARENGMSPESELREAFFDYFRRDFDPKTAHDGALAASYFAAHPIETAA
jgi:predicted metal-dependent hydrolase